jgi:hypothetical protein
VVAIVRVLALLWLLSGTLFGLAPGVSGCAPPDPVPTIAFTALRNHPTHPTLLCDEPQEVALHEGPHAATPPSGHAVPGAAAPLARASIRVVSGKSPAARRDTRPSVRVSMRSSPPREPPFSLP